MGELTVKPFKIQVTADLIALARQQDKGRCAVALAIRLANENLVRVQVTRDTISFTNVSEDQRYTIRSPEPIGEFVDRFDLAKANVDSFEAVVDPQRALQIKPVRHSSPLRVVKEAPKKSRNAKKRSTSHRPLPPWWNDAEPLGVPDTATSS